MEKRCQFYGESTQEQCKKPCKDPLVCLIPVCFACFDGGTHIVSTEGDCCKCGKKTTTRTWGCPGTHYNMWSDERKAKLCGKIGCRVLKSSDKSPFCKAHLWEFWSDRLVAELSGKIVTINSTTYTMLVYNNAKTKKILLTDKGIIKYICEGSKLLNLIDQCGGNAVKILKYIETVPVLGKLFMDATPIKPGPTPYEEYKKRAETAKNKFWTPPRRTPASAGAGVPTPVIPKVEPKKRSASAEPVHTEPELLPISERRWNHFPYTTETHRDWGFTRWKKLWDQPKCFFMTHRDEKGPEGVEDIKLVYKIITKGNRPLWNAIRVAYSTNTFDRNFFVRRTTVITSTS